MTSRPTHADDEPTHPLVLADRVATHAPPTPPRPVLEFASVEEMLRTLAYAELRAIMLAWARVPVRQPADLVRAAIDRTLAGGEMWLTSATVFAQRVRDTIRDETSEALDQLIRKAGPAPWDRPLAPGQHGDAAGIEIIFHHAGELAGKVRAHEPRSLSTAVALTEYVRSRVRRASGD